MNCNELLGRFPWRRSSSTLDVEKLDFRYWPNLPAPGKDSPMSTLLLSVMGAFAEFERALIRERQREGIAIAKAQVSRPEGEALP